MNQQELDDIVARLRRQKSDDTEVEAKACARGLSRSVWETISAFANTVGGTLILGLSEDGGFIPARGFDLPRVRDALITGLGDGDPSGTRLEPCPEYRVEDTFEVDGSPVLVIEIDELAIGTKPCHIRGRDLLSGSYKRVGDHDVHLNAREIFSLQNVLHPSGADIAIVNGATVEDLSGELVRRLTGNPTNVRMFRGAGTDEERLVRANVMDRNGGITLAGLLVCGIYPQQYHPRLFVDVAVHAGVRKAEPSARERFLDRVYCEGATGEVIDEAYAAILRNLRTYSVVEGSGRRDEHEIPGTAIREALANAVVHREYDEAFLGQAVQVDIYSDRVEVISPGGLWGGKTLENLGNGVSECRNKALMQLMSRVPDPDTDAFAAEGNGTGIVLMRNAMADRALREPEFDAGIDYFKVTLWRAGAELSDTIRWVRGVIGHDIDGHELAVAAILHRDGEASVRGVREQLGIDSDEIRDILKELVGYGIAVRNGRDAVRLKKSEDADRNRPPKQYWSEDTWRERVLCVLAENGAMTVAEIADALGRRREVTGVHLREMVEEGLLAVDSESGSRNRRYMLLQNTMDF